MANKTDAIGLFDSGIGGLSILNAVHQTLPNEKLVYLADQKGFPYGEKTPAELKQRALKISRFLLEQQCKIIVLACNTATVQTIDFLRKRLSLPFVGIEPAVKPAAKKAKKGILVLSSPHVAQSRRMQQLITEYAQHLPVYNQSCLLLVKTIEQGADKKAVRQALGNCLTRKMLEKVDIIILACTHFPLVKKEIEEFVGSKKRVIEPSGAVAARVKEVLKKKDLLAQDREGETVYLTTARESSFRKITFQEVDL